MYRVKKFKRFYIKTKDALFAYLVRLTGDYQLSKDIMQESYSRLLGRYGADNPSKSLLFTIARNVFLHHRRKQKRQVSLDEAQVDPSPSPERMVESQLEIARVHRVLQAVEEIDRAAFVLRVQHELPYAEISRVLQISVPAAKVKIHRVRKRLIASRIKNEERP